MEFTSTLLHDCPQCGSALAEAPGGLCPRCLMARVMMRTQTDAGGEMAAPFSITLGPQQLAAVAHLDGDSMEIYTFTGEPKHGMKLKQN